MNAAELMKFNIFNPLIRISSYNLDRQCTIHFSIYYFISHPASCEVLALFFFFPKRFFSRANPHENDSCNLFIRKFSIIISIGSMIVRFHIRYIWYTGKLFIRFICSLAGNVLRYTCILTVL